MNMNKILNHRTYIIVGILSLCVALTFMVRSHSAPRQIQASVSPLDVGIKAPIQFADSTRGAKKWLWEFGDGRFSTERGGIHLYDSVGIYQVRVSVDDKLEKKFIVNVRPSSKEDTESQLIQIVAPSTGLQGELVIFRGEGSSKDWRWEFGETGIVDAREKTVIYQYSEPGTYDVKLTTEETQYPIFHTIVIEPQYSDADTLDVESMIGDEIREKLQAIVDQKPFRKNYEYILSTYLCNDPNALIVVNNSKKNDFYSYCMGLRIMGRKRTVIENVLFDWADEDHNCIKKLIVIQTEKMD
jgi:hypothetical protein